MDKEQIINEGIVVKKANNTSEFTKEKNGRGKQIDLFYERLRMSTLQSLIYLQLAFRALIRII